MIHETIKYLLKGIDNPIIFEIGARQGEDSQFFIKNFLMGKFYLFEPLPSNFEKLTKNLDLDLTTRDNINAYQLAISDKTGEDFFYVSSDPENFNGSSSLNRPTKHLEEFPHVSFKEIIKVHTICLDLFCNENNIDHIDFIYCDSQGNEAKIIEGGQKALEKCRYFYGEHYGKTAMYEGQKPHSEWNLPGNWQILYEWPNDVLYKNLDYNTNII